MPRHSEPEYVVQWRKATANVPKCCHTCDNYDQDGKCVFHWAEPPANFAATEGACNDWTYELPF